MTVLAVVPPRPETLKSKLERLASVIADEVLAEGVALTTRLDAMKVLTNFRVGILRVKGKGGDDDDDPAAENFQTMRAALTQEDEE
jgi:hypothetical protein